jgi:hypothetical protein
MELFKIRRQSLPEGFNKENIEEILFFTEKLIFNI